jgi:6,7-dimethyl-8-ribityllumazine synthase
MKKIGGNTRGTGLRIAIISSRFNAEVTAGLTARALEALKETGVPEENITLIEVPGAFEIPLAAKRAALSKQFDGVIAIGCVIRGETAHFEYISHHATSGIGQVALETGVPIALGILTTDTDEQAAARSQPNRENKGYEAAMAAIEMINLLKQIPNGPSTKG